MANVNEHVYNSYSIDVYDILEFIDKLPLVKGSHPYAVSHRSTYYEFYAWLESRSSVRSSWKSEAIDKCAILRSMVLDWLKSRAMLSIHERDSARAGTVEAEREQGRLDGYSKLYDLIYEVF